MTTNVVAFFCEDIRQEADGKVTLIGIFPDNVSLQGGPLPKGQSPALPKLCVFTRVSFDPTGGSPIISSKMLNPDGSETDFGAIDQKAINDSRSAAIQQKNPIAGINMNIQSMPFVIPASGRFRFEVTVGKEKFLAGMMNVSLATTASTTES